MRPPSASQSTCRRAPASTRPAHSPTRRASPRFAPLPTRQQVRRPRSVGAARSGARRAEATRAADRLPAGVPRAHGSLLGWRCARRHHALCYRTDHLLADWGHPPCRIAAVCQPDSHRRASRMLYPIIVLKPPTCIYSTKYELGTKVAAIFLFKFCAFSRRRPNPSLRRESLIL